MRSLNWFCIFYFLCSISGYFFHPVSNPAAVCLDIFAFVWQVQDFDYNNDRSLELAFINSLFNLKSIRKSQHITSELLVDQCCRFLTDNPVSTSECEKQIEESPFPNLNETAIYISRIFDKRSNRLKSLTALPNNKTLAVVGAGPVGLLYGLAAWEAGVSKIVFLEKRMESTRSIWFDFTGSSSDSNSCHVLDSWGIFYSSARIHSYPKEETDTVSIICSDIEKFFTKTAMIASSSISTNLSTANSVQFNFGHHVIGYCASNEEHALLVQTRDISSTVLSDFISLADICIDNIDQHSGNLNGINKIEFLTVTGQNWSCKLNHQVSSEKQGNCNIVSGLFLLRMDLLVVADGSKSELRNVFSSTFEDAHVLKLGDLLEGEWKQTDVVKTSSNFMKSNCLVDGMNQSVDCIRLNLSLPSTTSSCCLASGDLLPSMKYTDALDLSLLSYPRLPYQRLVESDIINDVVANKDGIVLVNRGARLLPSKGSHIPGPREITGQEYQLRMDFDLKRLRQVTMLFRFRPNNDGNCPDLRKHWGTETFLSPFVPKLLLDGVVSVFKRFFFGYCEFQVLFSEIVGNSVLQSWNSANNSEIELLSMSRQISNLLLACEGDSYIDLEKLFDPGKIPLIEMNNHGTTSLRAIQDGIGLNSLTDRMKNLGHHVCFDTTRSFMDALVRYDDENSSSGYLNVFQIVIGRAGPRLAFSVENPTNVSLPVLIVGDASVTAHYRLGVGINHAIEGLSDWMFAVRKLLIDTSILQATDWLNYRMEARTTDIVRYQLFVMFFESYCEYVVYLYEVVPTDPGTMHFSDDYLPLTVALQNCLKKL